MKAYSTFLNMYSILSYLYRTTHEMNLGTVLFETSDLENKCWSPARVKLLSTRMIVEDLLPNPNILTMINDEVVSALFEYVELVYRTINKELQSNKRHIMLLAFSDALGGYMRHAVLPNVKFSFYAGTLDYSSVKKMQDLYQVAKDTLKTNGDGWVDPMCDSGCKCEPHSFSVSSPEDSGVCEFLTLYHGPSTENYALNGVSSNVVVPLPYFDRRIKPTVLAVPLKSYPLRGMRAPWGLNLVVRYYLTGYKCLIKKKSPPTLNEFQNGVYTWMIDEVVPLLSDDEIYPVFGGVLRVLATLQRLGNRYKITADLRSKTNQSTCTTPSTFSYVRRICTSTPAQILTFSKSRKIAIAIMIFLLIWFVIGFCFFCFKLRGRDGKSSISEVDSSKKPCICEGRIQGRVKSFTDSLKKSISKIKWRPSEIRGRSKSTDRSTNTDRSGSKDKIRTGFFSRRNNSRPRSPGKSDCMCFTMKEEVHKFDRTEEESFLEDINTQRKGRKDGSNSTKQRICPPSYLFGYDFQTSTSESASDSDSDLEMHRYSITENKNQMK